MAHKRKYLADDGPVILPISEVKQLSFIVSSTKFCADVSAFLSTLDRKDFFGDEIGQLARASTSITANLYEGLGRGNDSLYFLNHARMASGSVYECVFWLKVTGAPPKLVEACEILCDEIKDVVDRERSAYPLRKDMANREKKRQRKSPQP